MTHTLAILRAVVMVVTIYAVLIAAMGCHLSPAAHVRNLHTETDALRALCVAYQGDPSYPRDVTVTARCEALLKAP